MAEIVSTSFPYFNVARNLNVPYKDVLQIADMLDEIGLFDPVIIDKLLYSYVEQVWLWEQHRRARVVAEI